VGPANETPGLTGFAHLFEHMMFQGSGHVGEDAHFRLLEGAGASLVNGTTDFDRTNYMEDLPAEQLELALWLESDRMGFLLDRLDQTMLSNQQDVVRNERRQTVESAPYGLVEERLWQMLFPEGHPYYACVIGSHVDIQAARLEDVRDFFRRYYAPNNASLAIVGDIAPERTLRLVEKYFGSIPRGPEVPPVRAETPPVAGERRAVLPDQVELPRVYLAWLTAPAYRPGDAEAEVTARILGGGRASRLYRRLVYEDKIAQSVSAWQQPLTLGSVFQVTATAKPGHTADELERAVDEELARLAADGPTASELAGAQNAIHAGTIMSLESLGGFGGVADRLNRYNHHLGDPGRLEWDMERYAAVDAAAVQRVAAVELARERRAVVHAVPGEKGLPPDPPTPPTPEHAETEVESAEPWRSAEPAPAPRSLRPLPAARAFRLANGLSVLLTESHALPVIAADLVIRAGSASDPEGLPGLAGFTAAMLDEGTARRDAMAIARDLESIGAAMSTGASLDGSFVWVRALKAHADRALDLFADVALAPAFPADEIERVRNDRVTALLQRRDSPSQTASRVLYPCLYGPRHPYGHIALGDEDALGRMGRTDLLEFYRAAFTPADAALVLAGDLSEAEARALAEKWFGAWRGPATEARRPAAGTPVGERVILVDKPGSPQTMLLVAQTAVPRSHPDFEALNVMNQILGGLFSSRINLNLRERHGYTYGAFSGLSESRGVGPLWVGASVRTDVTGPSLREIFAEVEAMLERPVSDEELRLAKDSITRSLPALFETTESTVSTIGSLFLNELPADYYAPLPERVEALSAREIHEATRRHLAPERMRIVAVGDRAAIEPQIAELGLGGIAYRDADGKSAPAAG
jgi:zinc protease